MISVSTAEPSADLAAIWADINRNLEAAAAGVEGAMQIVLARLAELRLLKKLTV